MKKALFLIRSAPYGMATGGEGFRAMVGAAGMEIKTRTVLVEDGVFIAKKGQSPDKIGMSNLEEAYRQLSELGVTLFIHRESAHQRCLVESELIAAQWITTTELKNLVNDSDVVISFI